MGAEAAEDTPRTEPLDGRRILIVDDYPDTLDMLSQACTAYGARASTAASAREALALIAAEPPDAIITDIGLRGEDGVWLLGEIRRTHASIPVIALTGRGPEEALAAGFDAVLLKPTDPWELCEELQRLLGQRYT
jgi:DNA-binding response OmpR family regulator